MQSPLHRAAVVLAIRGLHVFPVAPRAKTNATAHGVLDATVDPSVIDRWWRANDYNVAIATGRVSNIFVVDIDGVDAEAELRKLEAKHGLLPATVETITANGRHLYFRYPTGTTIGNSVGKIAAAIDTRGDNGYVLAPPSVHPSGKRYAWSVDSANAIAPAPDWLVQIIAAPANGSEATPPSEWRRLATEGVAEGARNDTVARLTGHLLRHYVDARVTLELIRTWNAVRCRPPLADKEVVTIVNSVAGKELKRRQEVSRGR